MTGAFKPVLRKNSAEYGGSVEVIWMSGAPEEAERFRKHMEQLHTAYLQMFPQEEERLARLKTCIERGEALHARTTMTGHVTASAYILAPDRQCLLLVYHRALEDWL